VTVIELADVGIFANLPPVALARLLGDAPAQPARTGEQQP